MNLAIYIAIFVPLFIIIAQENSSKRILATRITRSKNQKEQHRMLELAKQFIGKECLLYTFNSQVIGIIKEVCGNAILIENKNTLEAVNLDFIVRIREYPKGKNGMKKSLILD